jgi:hypothetical protein
MAWHGVALDEQRSPLRDQVSSRVHYITRRYSIWIHIVTTHSPTHLLPMQFRKLVAKHATFSKEVSGGGEAVDAAADELMDTVKDADAEGARDFVDIVHGIAMKSNFQVLSQDVFEFADKAEFVRGAPPCQPSLIMRCPITCVYKHTELKWREYARDRTLLPYLDCRSRHPFHLPQFVRERYL